MDNCSACLAGHAIVCGYGRLGSRVAIQLRERGCEVVVIDSGVDMAKRKRIESSGCRLIEGDICDGEVLDLAGISSASCVLAVTSDDRANLEAAIEARKRNSRASVVVRLFDQALAMRVETVFNIRALSASFLSSPAFVSAAADNSIAAAFNIDCCYLSLFHKLGKKHSKRVCVVKKGSSLKVGDPGLEDSFLFARVQNVVGSVPLNIRHKRKKAKGAFQCACEACSYLHPVRFLREIRDIWRHSTLVSKRLLIALLAIGILSVLVFSITGRMSPLDALYFVVTTMTTVGYGDFNLQNSPPGLKIFGIGMMLCGAALLATLYAIIADHVLTARVEHMLGRREVNLCEHTVVVGLGNVGYRVANDLHMLGVDVVAVESDETSENVSSARTLFPVIVGDGSKESVIRKAGIERAQAVLALTDDPMVNLSVALNAREHNPDIKTLVRTYEFDLAEKFGSFGLNKVISTSAISSPAFVDAALYPGVQGSFIWDGDDILVARHIVDPDSPLCGKSIGSIGEEMGIAIVLVSTGWKIQYEMATPEVVLQEGCKVVALLVRDKMRLLAVDSV